MGHLWILHGTLTCSSLRTRDDVQQVFVQCLASLWGFIPIRWLDWSPWVTQSQLQDAASGSMCAPGADCTLTQY